VFCAVRNAEQRFAEGGSQLTFAKWVLKLTCGSGSDSGLSGTGSDSGLTGTGSGSGSGSGCPVTGFKAVDGSGARVGKVEAGRVVGVGGAGLEIASVRSTRKKY
jgi:hypothetical protein